MLHFLDIDSRIRARDTVGDSRIIDLPVIVRVTEFDDDAVESFSQDVSEAHRTGQTVIPIVIDSCGGDAYALWSMIDILEKATLPIATIIEGKAMSCGAVLFTCGADGMRFMGPNAVLMIHDVTNWSSGEKSEKPDEIKANADETERLNRNMYAFMEKRLGKRKNTLWDAVQKKGRADWYITPREAVKLGLADHIKVPTFRTTVSVETTLEY